MIADFWRRACVALSFPCLLVLGAVFWGGSTPPDDNSPSVAADSIFVFELDGRIELPPPMPGPPAIV
jgi:hypothetical protein